MATGNEIVLSVRNLTKTYRAAGEQIAVLRGVNLSVAAGEGVALSGGSGSGKSTLLHLIAGLDRPDGGEIRLADTSVSDLTDAGRAALRRDRLGLVFQQFNLIPSLNVRDNLAFQSRIAGCHDAAWHAELVQRLGLGSLLDRYPEQLSVEGTDVDVVEGGRPRARPHRPGAVGAAGHELHGARRLDVAEPHPSNGAEGRGLPAV